MFRATVVIISIMSWPCTVSLGEVLASREKQIGTITDPALEMRLLAYAKAQLPRRVSARDITEEAWRLGATAERAYERKQALQFLERHAEELAPPEVRIRGVLI
jgi:hypothetical protein